MARQPIWALLIGATIVVPLTVIPVVGGAIKFAVILFALGGLIVAITRRMRPAVLSTTPVEHGIGQLIPVTPAG